jgi:N-acetyl-1-D-myo-inositol-2-amino-2-deoxy-alpha-D-glucopyranoside deacetylase
MCNQLRLLAVLARPGEESVAAGGILAKYAAQGVQNYLVTASRGERAWHGEADAYPGEKALGEARERELRVAARSLGVCEVALLDYADGELERARPAEAVSQLVRYVRRMRPHVILTVGPDAQPGHALLSRLTTTAVVAAADAAYAGALVWPPHRVEKLYYLSPDAGLLAARVTAGWDHQPFTGEWPVEGTVAHIDAGGYWRQVLRALTLHGSQYPNWQGLQALSPETHRRLWQAQVLYRAFSRVNGDAQVEQDLFAGIRNGEIRTSGVRTPKTDLPSNGSRARLIGLEGVGDV